MIIITIGITPCLGKRAGVLPYFVKEPNHPCLSLAVFMRHPCRPDRSLSPKDVPLILETIGPLIWMKGIQVLYMMMNKRSKVLV